MIDSKLIMIIGAPSSGKSTLATDVHTELKKMGKNSIFVPECATDYIAEYGIPNTPTDQLVIFYEQVSRENMYLGTKEYIICDSSSLLNYFYFRRLFNNKLMDKDVAVINHLQKQILKTINKWYKVYYVPPILDNVSDGIRYHNENEIVKLDKLIKSYLELENIEHTDLSSIDIKLRTKFILDNIK